MTAANEAIAAIRTAIAAAADLGASETGLNTITADGFAAAVRLHQARGSQRTAADGAIDAAMKAVAGLSDGSSTNQQVMNAIEEARKAIAAATDLSETQTGDYTTQVSGFEATFLTHRQGQQRTAITEAITDARTKVGALDAGSSVDDVQAADNAVKKVDEAIAAGADIDTSAYSTEVGGIKDDLTDHNTRETQRAGIRTALDAAITEIDGLDEEQSGKDAVEKAQELVKAAESAISGAESHLPKGEIDAFKREFALVKGEIDRIAPIVTARVEEEELEASRPACAADGLKRNEAGDDCVIDTSKADAEKRTADAKALLGALGETVATGFLFTPTSIGDVDDTGPANAITLEKQSATVAALGGWNGADYKSDDAGTGDGKHTPGMARLYSSQGAGETIDFAAFAGTEDALTALTGVNAGTYTLGTDGNAKITGFPSTGQQSYANEAKVTGAYSGVSGTYTCTVDGGCTSIPVTGGGSTLSAGWVFKPVAGATIRKNASEYLYFGWWVRKDKDGPTHARSAYGSVGFTGADHEVNEAAIDNANLIGEAAYTGRAAGKYAVNDPFDATKDEHGHFTADASLKANFVSGNGSSLEGTIDDFRLNDGTADPGWTVMLNKTDSVSDIDQRGVWEGSETEWHIGGSKVSEVGNWEASMYRTVESDNNTPDTVIGSFQSEIGATHEMRGAFGAELDD